MGLFNKADKASTEALSKRGESHLAPRTFNMTIGGLEKALLKEMGLTQVRAIPQPKAGGSVPAAAWKKMEKPALAVSIQADAAIDIGDTLVGMHIRPVAVPLRISTSHVGHANLVMAYSRLPYIGGARAVYTE